MVAREANGTTVVGLLDTMVTATHKDERHASNANIGFSFGT